MGSTYFHKRIPDRTYIRKPRGRSKTFNSEATAKTWAEKNGIKKYSLEYLKDSETKTKIRVLVE